MTNEFQEALDDLNDVYDDKHISDVDNEEFGAFFRRHPKTIRRALKGMIALMQEPSVSMVSVARDMGASFGVGVQFKAMRDQMLKELEQ